MHPDLLEIASEPKADHVYSVQNFSVLSTINVMLAEEICGKYTTGAFANISKLGQVLVSLGCSPQRVKNLSYVFINVLNEYSTISWMNILGFIVHLSFLLKDSYTKFALVGLYDNLENPGQDMGFGISQYSGEIQADDSYFYSLITDVDECKFGNHTCSQICINTEGSYVCDCHDGFILHQDGSQCISKLETLSFRAV